MSCTKIQLSRFDPFHNATVLLDTAFHEDGDVALVCRKGVWFEWVSGEWFFKMERDLRNDLWRTLANAYDEERRLFAPRLRDVKEIMSALEAVADYENVGWTDTESGERRATKLDEAIKVAERDQRHVAMMEAG